MNLKDRVSKDGKTDIKVSIIVLAYKQLPLTIQCFESILATKPKGMELEIVLMSNGSGDATENWIDYQDMLKREDGITVRGVYSSDNLGFAGGCNEALRCATGDIIVFLNNDTIVTPGWLSELLVPLILVDDIAFTAPVSNYAGGMQGIAVNYTGQKEMFEFAIENFKTNHNKTELAGMVTGLCLAGRRDTIDKLIGFHTPEGQLFDECFKIGMWEDNDLSLRVQLLGMKCLICYGAFIHHEGSATFKSLGKTKDCFYDNQKVFQNKWKEIFPKQDEQKVVAMIRIKNGEDFIDGCLQSLVGWVDEIVILDNGSTDGTLPIISAFNNAYPGKIILDSETFKDKQLKEFEEREHLFKITQARNPTWIVWMDVDHEWDQRIIRYLPRLVCPTDPQILCWRFPILNFWRGREKYRTDGEWGRTAGYGMFRSIPGQKLINNDHPQGFHCLPVPVFQHQNIGFCDVNMLHYGYCDPVEARRKYDWYQVTDTDKRKELIGGEGDYRHLIDETDLQLQTYYPNNFISLNMLVRDHEWEAAAKTIESLDLVVDQFVIVHTGYEKIPDEINERITRNRWVEIHHYPWNDNFSIPRNFGLAHCKGRWILHLDPDESISPAQIPFLAGLIRQEFILGWSFNIINYFSDPEKAKAPEANLQQALRLFRNIPSLIYANPVHETLDDAVRLLELKERDIHKSNMTISHSGFLLPPEEFAAKVNYYATLNEKWAKDSPEDPRPFYNLGIHYLDMDDMGKALDYLEQAREKNNKGDTGLFQVGMALSGIYLRSGLNHTAETLKQLPADHPQRQRFEEIINYLSPRVGKVRHFLKKEEDEIILTPPLVTPAITPLLNFIKEGMIGIEVGVQQGYSSELIMKQGVGLLLCIDPWEDHEEYAECRGWTDFSKWEAQTRKRLEPWIKDEKVFMVKGKSLDVVKGIEELSDFIFIDGNHEYEWVLKDIEAWWPKVKSGGFLSGHDYYVSPDEFHRVKEAVDKWAEDNNIKIEVYGDCWLARK